jgi:hypothetical protein
MKLMAKPLGYYCADSSLFDELVEKYGSQLQALSREQKLFLIVSIAGDLRAQAEGEENSLTKPDFTARIHQELTKDQKESLLLALVHQIREQRPASKD